MFRGEICYFENGEKIVWNTAFVWKQKKKKKKWKRDIWLGKI